MKTCSLALTPRVCLTAALVMATMGATAAPGEDTIVLTGPVSYISSPLSDNSKSDQMHPSTDMPAWMRARISRYTAKAYSATADDGSIVTDNDVVTTSTSQGLRKTCVQEVGTTTTTSDSLGGRYGPGQKEQVVVLRGDLINVCR